MTQIQPAPLLLLEISECQILIKLKFNINNNLIFQTISMYDTKNDSINILHAAASSLTWYHRPI